MPASLDLHPAVSRNTPRRLRLALAAGWILSGLLAVVVLSAWAQHRHVVTTVGVDVAPSVEAAHQIRIRIEQLDVDLAGELLDAGDAPGAADAAAPGGSVTRGRADFDADLTEIGKAVVNASKEITYADAELIPLETIEERLGRYLMAAQRARDAHARGDRDATVRAYRDSYQLLARGLIPAARELDAANDRVLQATYDHQQRESGWTLAMVLTAGAALVLMLAVTQWLLARAFRRSINPALAAATAIAIALVALAAGALIGNARDLRAAKQDAYDAVVALLNARGDAYEARAAASRGLLDPSLRDPAARPLARVEDRLRIARTHLARADRDPDPARDAPTQATQALSAFAAYGELDAQVRRLDDAGRHGDAVSLCLGTAADQHDGAFTRFDAVLGRWLAIEQARMYRHVDHALSDLSRLPVAAGLGSLMIAILVFVGLRPRLKEYA
jgi:hypothetical protein